MNRMIKMYGKGFVYGVKHPFLDEPAKRTKDMTFIDGVLGDLGMATSQAIIINGLSFLMLVGIGYAVHKYNERDPKVKMVIEEKPKK